jgi:tetratricopeptide (TPR) repeat protein
MRRTLNLKFFLGLLLAVPTLTLGLHFAHGFQLKRNARALLQRAEKEEDRAKKIDFLRRYLVFEPGDAEAQAEFALQLSEQTKALPPRLRLQAFLALEQAVRLSPDRADLRRTSVEVAMSLGLFKDAEGHLEILLNKAGPDAELQDLMGQCLEATGKYKEIDKDHRGAKEAYETAIEIAPSQVDTYVRLANLLQRRLEQPNEADDVMSDMVSANVDSFQAHFLYAIYLRDLGRESTDPKMSKEWLEQSAAELEEAGTKAKEDGQKADVLWAAGNLALDRGQLDKARGLFEQGIKKHGDNPRFLIGRAQLELRGGQLKKALECLDTLRQSLEKQSKAHPGTVWMLADLFLDANKPKEAEKEIQKLVKEAFQPAMVDYLNARLAINQGFAQHSTKKFAEARDILERRRQELSADARVDIFLGQCYEQLGNPDQREAAFTRAAKKDPSSVAARLGLASSLLAVGKLEDALIEYRWLMWHLPDEPAPRLAVARTLLFRNLQLPVQEQKWDEITEILTGMPKKSIETPEFVLLNVDVLLAQGKPEDAIKNVEDARKKYPKEVRYWLAKAILKARPQQSEAKVDADEALKVLDEAKDKLGDQLELRLARAQWLTRKGAKEARQALKKLGEDTDKFTDDDKVRLYLGLAGAYVRLSSPKDAKRLLEQVTEWRPDDLGTRLLLLDLAILAIQQGKVDVLEDSLIDEIGRLEGEKKVLWRYAKAARLVLGKGKKRPEELAAARELLDQVARSRPSWSRVPLLQASIEELGGDKDAAIDRYQEALNMGERRPEVISRTVLLLIERNRPDEAQRVLKKTTNANALTGDLAKLASAVSLLNQDPAEDTVKLLEQAVKDPKVYADWLFRGQMFWATSKRPGLKPEEKEDYQQKASEAFHEAIKLEPSKPDGRVALVLFLVDRDQNKVKKEAEAEVAKMELLRADDDQSSLALARCYLALDKRDKAEKRYLGLLKKKPNNVDVLRAIAAFYLGTGQSPKAEPHLQSLMNSRNKAAAAWARRAQAFVLANSRDLLANSRDYQKSKKALELIERNLKDKKSPEDERAKALVLAMRPRGRKSAIKTLEESFSRLRPAPAEEFLLAQLYEADGKLENAKASLFGLVSKNGSNPDYLAYYIRFLLRHEGKEGAAQARVWLKRFEKLERDTFRAVELEARVLKGEDQTKAGLELVQNYVLKHKEKEGAAVLAAGAALLALLEENRERPEAARPHAEKMYRDFVAETKATQPGNILVLAAFLANRQRINEALKLCDEAWGYEKIPRERVAGVAVAILRLSQQPPGPADFRLLEERIEKEIAANKALWERLTLVLADLYDTRGDYQKALDTHDRILRRNRRNWLALNNRAWLLTFFKGKAENALDLVNKAIQEGGPWSNLLDTRGNVYLALGDGAKAVKDLEQAVAETPNAARWYHLFRAYLLVGRTEDAMDAWKKATKELNLTEKDLHPLELEEYKKVKAKFGEN